MFEAMVGPNDAGTAPWRDIQPVGEGNCNERQDAE
jgi:hypothetical protein